MLIRALGRAFCVALAEFVLLRREMMRDMSDEDAMRMSSEDKLEEKLFNVCKSASGHLNFVYQPFFQPWSDILAILFHFFLPYQHKDTFFCRNQYFFQNLWSIFFFVSSKNENVSRGKTWENLRTTFIAQFKSLRLLSPCAISSLICDKYFPCTFSW